MVRWTSALRRRLRNRVRADRRATLGYLRLARFLATRGINPPLSGNAEDQERRWRDQGTAGSSDSPQTYVDHTDSMQILFEDIIHFLPKDARILEIGCNAGRNLGYLYRQGFRNLCGIELGREALKTFEIEYPQTYASTHVICGNAVEEIRSLADRSFDLVFTRGVLVNIHPRDESLFDEMCRVSRAFLLTSELEGSWTSWPRDFGRVFERRGYKMVALRFLVSSADGSLEIPATVDAEGILGNPTIRLFSRIETDTDRDEQGRPAETGLHQPPLQTEQERLACTSTTK